MSIVPDKAVRHERSCADYGARMLDHGPPDCRKIYGETTYHRTTYMGVDFRGSTKVKSSKASWVAVQGTECMCFVTWNKAGVNSEEPNFTDIFFFQPFEAPQVKVSLKLGTKEVNIGNGSAASFAEYNEIAVIYFLRKMLRYQPHSTYDETLKVAVYLFDQLFPVGIKAKDIKIFVLRKGEENTKLFPTEKIEALLDDSRQCYQEIKALLNI